MPNASERSAHKDAPDTPAPWVPDDVTPAADAPPKTHLPAAPLSETERAERLLDAGEPVEKPTRSDSAAHRDNALPGDEETQDQHSG